MIIWMTNGGLPYGDIIEMHSVDRRWYLSKFTKWQKLENDAVRDAAKKTR